MLFDPGRLPLLEQGRGSSADVASGQLRGFQLFLKTYAYSKQTDTYEQVPDVPDHLPQQICQALKALQLIETAGTEEWPVVV